MKKVMLMVAVSLSALAGCAADATDDGTDVTDGASTRDKMILVDTKAPVVLPAEPANPWATAISGEGPDRQIEFNRPSGLIRPDNIRLPDLSRGGIPCGNCARVVDPLQP
jgi:hypothetical protein